MARGQDLSNTLTMLHTTLIQTGTNLQDALNKGIDTLEASGRTAQRDTTEAVVNELSRMRSDLRDAKNRLATNRDELSEEVRVAVTLLRQEVQKVKAAVDDRPVVEAEPQALLPGEAESASRATSYEAAAALPNSESGEAAPVSQPLAAAAADSLTPSAADADPARSEALPAAPALPVGTENEDEGPGLEEQIRQAVHAALADEVAALHTFLAGLSDAQSAQATARGEQRQELTEIRGELSTLATSFEEWQARQAAAQQGAGAPDVTKDHSTLLQQAARVSSAVLVCHRDMWEFVAAHAGRHPHFRVPAKITDHGDERVSTTVSGRSLIAVLISLYDIRHTAGEGDGDWELATTLYHRIHHQLAALTSDGEPVTIVLDDRSHPSPDGTDGTPLPATDPPADGAEPADGDPPAPTE
ncbi:hypothetical protein [Streptomyces apocyni]|uniref:hypothetical protein n=1 Tax=Streptomyces apocyni TaxID=2654677 RepID=UPI0012EA5449|nr:hypothetical protein [Streptomyces apocyni]